MIDGQGDSAILWAARQGFPEVIRYLLSKGVHLNQQNKVGMLNFELKAADNNFGSSTRGP